MGKRNRPRNDAGDCGSADALLAEQVYSTYGMTDTHGAMVGANGAGLNSIDQDHPASAAATAAGAKQVSPAFTLQRARAARLRDAGPAGRGSGRRSRLWRAHDPRMASGRYQSAGRNQMFWMREAKRLGRCLWRGDQLPLRRSCFRATPPRTPGAAHRADFEAAHGATLQQALICSGAPPRLEVVVNGGDVNTLADLGETAGA